MYSKNSILMRRKVSAALQGVPKPSDYYYDEFISQPEIDNVEEYIRGVNWKKKSARAYGLLVLDLILQDLAGLPDPDECVTVFRELVAHLPEEYDRNDEISVLHLRKTVFLCISEINGASLAESFAETSLSDIRKVWPEFGNVLRHYVHLSTNLPEAYQRRFKQELLQKTQDQAYAGKMHGIMRKLVHIERHSHELDVFENDWLQRQPDWSSKDQKHLWMLGGFMILHRAGRHSEALLYQMLSLSIAPCEFRSSQLVDAFEYSIHHAPTPHTAVNIAAELSLAWEELYDQEQQKVVRLAEDFCIKCPEFADLRSISELRAAHARD